ncbi:MAG TPA: peptidoglycan-associated lipoprotein Pal [Gammaproteobacteria bacterium]|nr:peptidoglycan-associated lipoprotein Pal [Gammaproteobacteria bacterium]
MKFPVRFLITLIPVALLAACATTGETTGGGEAATSAPAPAATQPSSSMPAQSSTAGGMEGAETMAAPAETGFAADPLSDPNSILAKRVIYFDFDSTEIKPEFQALIEAHGRYLAEHPDVSVTLEGHADERGTREYNMALGERRAKAVRRFLAAQGASFSQMKVVSYGEERPVAFGHDEKSWRLNRRVEIVYRGR